MGTNHVLSIVLRHVTAEINEMWPFIPFENLTPSELQEVMKTT